MARFLIRLTTRIHIITVAVVGMYHTFFTVSGSAMLDLSYSYLKKTIQVESSGMHHSYREESEHHRKTGNVNSDTND